TDYVLETTWDAFDRIAVLKYPTVANKQLSVQYDYHPNGTLYKLSNPATAELYWSLREEDASGIPLTEQFGDSITTTRYLDNRKRLKFLETIASSTQSTLAGNKSSSILLQRLAYDYHPGGLVKSRYDVPDDRSARVTEDFEYDFLGRLSM